MKNIDSLDRFFHLGVHVETRAIYIGDGDEGIDAGTAQAAIKALHVLGESAPIDIYIHSFGGCWYSGMAIYDAIRCCKAETNGYVVGCAMSMGSIILQACTNRYIYPHGTLMLHGSTETIIDASAATLNRWAEHAKRSSGTMFKIYADRSGKTPAFWRKKCAADLVLDACEAKKLGLVDDIYS